MNRTRPVKAATRTLSVCPNDGILFSDGHSLSVVPAKIEDMPVKRTKSQYARLMELDRKIRDGGYPNCLTFAESWGVSQKTVQRDIDFLRDQCGAPIAYERERKGFYYEDQSWWLPSVALSEGELMGVLLAARVAEQYRGSPVAKQIERTFAKLVEMLPAKVSVNPALLYDRFTFTAPPAKPINEKVWTTLVRGLLALRTLKIVYRTFDGGADEVKESRIAPYHIANLQGEWYVFSVLACLAASHLAGVSSRAAPGARSAKAACAPACQFFGFAFSCARYNMITSPRPVGRG